MLWACTSFQHAPATHRCGDVAPRTCTSNSPLRCGAQKTGTAQAPARHRQHSCCSLKTAVTAVWLRRLRHSGRLSTHSQHNLLHPKHQGAIPDIQKLMPPQQQQLSKCCSHAIRPWRKPALATVSACASHQPSAEGSQPHGVTPHTLSQLVQHPQTQQNTTILNPFSLQPCVADNHQKHWTCVKRISQRTCKQSAYVHCAWSTD